MTLQFTVDPPSASSSKPAPVRRGSWVPIRSLGPRHRDRILRHLLALDEHDRYLRFGYAAGNEQIAHYVRSLDFERDEVFGIFNRKLELIGVAHLACGDGAGRDARGRVAEFGVSVLGRARGRGLGARLFDCAVLHARNRGIGTLLIHALSENTAMLRLVGRAGAKVSRLGSESEATLQLPPDNLASHVDALVEDRAAEIDYLFKRQTHRIVPAH
jgi:GNAT superfamily N-acetyltransferase